MPTLAANSLIVITGITGFIASHVGLSALKAGHRVRGTVRSRARGETLRAAYEKQGIPAAELDKCLEFVIVDDLSSEQQYSKALEGADGVAHVALDFSKFRDSHFIDEVVEGTLSLLRAAKEIPSIKRVVLTSSSAAVVSPPMYRDKILTGEDWNDEVLRIVENNEPTDQDPIVKKASTFFFYGAAKAKAEKAAWEFVRSEKPRFDLVSILPNMNLGPVLHGDPTSTAQWLASILKNDRTILDAVAPQWYIDVRDCGRLHVLGLTSPSTAGKRIWAAARPFGWNAILAILRENFPKLQVPEDFEGGEEDRQRIDNTPATELLGGWISLEQSVIDLAKSLGY